MGFCPTPSTQKSDAGHPARVERRLPSRYCRYVRCDACCSSVQTPVQSHSWAHMYSYAARLVAAFNV